ncbi:MAG: MBL fold metallo-hydrolase [Anaerolineae bacterium]|jgi:glyoxylase-like metal-dependent hydrolase (beta-lactamase superfamily II)
MKQFVFPVRLPFKLPISDKRSVDRFVYAYLVLGEQLCLVDTGAAGYHQGVIDALAALDKSVEEIDWVVNTHEHPDHIGGNAFFQEAARPRFACHSAAVRWIEDLDLQFQERPIHAFYTVAGDTPVRITDRLEDGDTIDLGGGVTLEVILTPGHSPGSIALFCPQEGALITADTLPPTGGLPLYADAGQVRASLRRMAGIPGVKKLYTSHQDDPFEGEAAQERIQAGLDYLERMDALVPQVVQDLPAGASPEEIAAETLSRLGFDPPPVLPIVVTSIMTHAS